MKNQDNKSTCGTCKHRFSYRVSFDGICFENMYDDSCRWFEDKNSVSEPKEISK